MKKLSKSLLVLVLCACFTLSLSGCNFITDLWDKIRGRLDEDEKAVVYSFQMAYLTNRLTLNTDDTFQTLMVTANGYTEERISFTGTYTQDDKGVYLVVKSGLAETKKFGIPESSTGGIAPDYEITLYKKGTALIPDNLLIMGSLLFKQGEAQPSSETVFGFATLYSVFGSGYHIKVTQGTTLEQMVASNDDQFVALRGDSSGSSFALTSDKVSGWDSSVIGDRVFQINFAEGQTFDVICRVTPAGGENELDISDLPEYVPVGTALSDFVSDKTVQYTSEGSTADVPLTASMVSGWDSSTEKEVTVTVTHNGISQKNIISFYNAANIRIKSFDISLADFIQKGTNPDISIFGITKTDGSSETSIALPDSRVTATAFQPNTAGIQTVAVTYGGVTERKVVYVCDDNNNLPQRISIPSSTVLTVTGGSSNFADISVTVIMMKGAEKTVNLTQSMLINYNPATAYEGQRVYIKYSEGGYDYYTSIAVNLEA